MVYTMLDSSLTLVFTEVSSDFTTSSAHSGETDDSGFNEASKSI